MLAGNSMLDDSLCSKSIGFIDDKMVKLSANEKFWLGTEVAKPVDCWK